MPVIAASRPGIRCSQPPQAMSDDFARFADNTSLDGETSLTGGRIYVSPTGSVATVVGGRVVPESFPSGAQVFFAVPSAVQEMEFDFIVGDDPGNRVASVLLRTTSTGSAFYSFDYDAAGTANITRNFLVLATYSPAPSPAGTVLRLALSVDASNLLTAKVGGVQVLQVPADVGLSGTWCGFTLRGVGTATPNALDNLVAHWGVLPP